MILKSTFITEAPSIDGRLDDITWDRSADVDEYFTTYSPVYGNILLEKTQVWISNDDYNVYFAFYCHDSEPDKIKSSITKHDDVWNDDWIGFNLDPLGNKSFGYVLVSNPQGIQGDLLDSPSTGGDESPDYIWYSAGVILEDGYSVEIQVPLKNITYNSGENVEMNIIFERKIPRLGLGASFPPVPVGQTFFAGMTKVIFSNLKNQVKLQSIPSVTYNSSWKRTTPNLWSKGNGKTEFGITAKYGLTSSIFAEATYNPDFSHIESDAFQVLINQRYPIYYSEKRPFFMEAANSFSIAIGSLAGRGLLSVAHTRNIVDPLWGAKLKGDLQNFSFGFLASGDEWPGRRLDSLTDGTSINPYEGKIANFMMGRLKYNLTDKNHVGTIYSGRESAGKYNRVIGADANLRFGDGNHLIKANFLNSFSNDSQKTSGVSGNLAYSFTSHAIEMGWDYEYLDPDFKMESAFINRTGISKYTGLFWYHLYPDSKSLSWLNRFTPQVFGYYLRDVSNGQIDLLYKGGFDFNFVNNGSLRVEYFKIEEYWLAKRLIGGYLNIYAGIQSTNWLTVYSMFRIGDKFYYSTSDPFVGKGITTDFELTIQLNKNLSLNFEHQHYDLFNKNNDEKVYNIDIIISKTTYQFNKYLFLRAILQYDSSIETVLIDALLAYELVPGSVLQFGYGALYKNVMWENNTWLDEGNRKKYYNTDQSLFLKVSYLIQY